MGGKRGISAFVAELGGIVEGGVAVVVLGVDQDLRLRRQILAPFKKYKHKR